MRFAVLFLFSTLAVMAQSPRTHDSLPDAPSASQPSTIVRVCWKIGHTKECTPPGDREFLQSTLDNYRESMPGNELQFWMEPAKKAGFWTVGRWDASHPLRTNRETLRSPWFWGGEIAMWGTAFANVEVTRNQKQLYPVPKHGELYIDAYLPLIPLSGMHYLADRYICRGLGLLGVGFASSWHGYEAVKGYYP